MHLLYVKIQPLFGTRAFCYIRINVIGPLLREKGVMHHFEKN